MLFQNILRTLSINNFKQFLRRTFNKMCCGKLKNYKNKSLLTLHYAGIFSVKIFLLKLSNFRLLFYFACYFIYFFLSVRSLLSWSSSPCSTLLTSEGSWSACCTSSTTKLLATPTRWQFRQSLNME